MTVSREAAWAARKGARGAHRACNPETEFTAGWEAREAEMAAAWDDGHAAGQHNEHEGRPGREMTNPYRTATPDPISKWNAWESDRYDKHPRYDDAGTGVENEQERDDD